MIGNMPCNPSIGGTSKGHLVREIDALGGEMGVAADKNTLQNRMLNLGKGPAVHSLRAQIDRRDYSVYMKHALERQEGLDLVQAEIVRLERAGETGGWRLYTRLNQLFEAKCAVIATGTFLDGKIYVGENCFSSGPDGTFPAIGLSQSLKDLGVTLRRFKTGTPSRVNKRSVDIGELEPQYGDEPVTPFSFACEEPPKNLLPCYVTYTNEETKRVILANLDRSPLFSGVIEGVGPRYCPSIEDKMVRFAEKERHQIFIEPCGLDTEEMYLQGLSSSLPIDVQEAFIHTIPGLTHAKVMRNAYAIEYDCVDPLSLKASLEFHGFPGLFGAGQFNGSSGYEEAAAQGLIAGINAALRAQSKPPFILERASSYIGTLIDDLVTKGCNEPYRMMTSRSEYRLVLRQDNADLRLTERGYRMGLVSEARYQKLLKKIELIEAERKRVETVVIAPGDAVNAMLVSRETSPLSTGCKLAELIRRPQLNYEALAPFDATRPDLPYEIFEQVEISLKYEGYIKRQSSQIAETARLERRPIPENIDYAKITNLRIEAREKLSRIRPENIGQASRISGVSPADISVLLIWLKEAGV
jgi:tRNA uridine 5-carboxymethylaminomethyl modification enzyme